MSFEIIQKYVVPLCIQNISFICSHSRYLPSIIYLTKQFGLHIISIQKEIRNKIHFIAIYKIF